MTEDQLKEQFPIGRNVVLRSGGPAMVVEMYRNDGLLCTQWFDGGQLMRDCFDPLCVALEPV